MVFTSAQKERWRAALAVILKQSEDYRMNRGYSQRRRILGYGLSAKADQLDDCSGFDSKSVYLTNVMTRLHVTDPLGEHFTGWGNTESIQAQNFHPAPVDKYLVGDIALWGKNDWDTTHTAICRQKGTRKTAIFTSHGHQSWRFASDAPEPLYIVNFPEHFIGVYRLPELV